MKSKAKLFSYLNLFKKNAKLSLAIFVLSFMFTQVSFGDVVVTNVSGVMANNSQVDISGSGFGIKTPAAPVLWDTFENGIASTQVGTNSGIYGKWQEGAGWEYPRYSSTNRYAGTKSAVLNFLASANSYSASLCQTVQGWGTVYADWKVTTQYQNKSRNWKPFRIYGTKSNDYPQFVFTNLCGSTQLHVLTDGCGDISPYVGKDYSEGQWQHFQFELISAASGSGRVKFWQNGGTPVFSNTAMTTRCSGDDYDDLRIGHFADGAAVDSCQATSEFIVYIDNVYIDRTLARIELGNASTYDNSTHREIQIPTAWSNTGITIKVNIGIFASNQPAYIYITDANGNVNNQGYPVIIGAATSAPAIPKNLKTVQ